MPSIELLTEIAAAAGADADGDGRLAPTFSSAEETHIAAFNPAMMALILAVVKAAKDYMRSDADVLVMINFDSLERALAALEAAP